LRRATGVKRSGQKDVRAPIPPTFGLRGSSHPAKSREKA
jgi:hypothetical protein